MLHLPLEEKIDTLAVFAHPVHVSNVVKLYTGFHPCHFYEHAHLKELFTISKTNYSTLVLPGNGDF